MTESARHFARPAQGKSGQSFPEFLPEASADRHSRIRLQTSLTIACIKRDNLGDTIEIHNRTAMHALEAEW